MWHGYMMYNILGMYTWCVTNVWNTFKVYTGVKWIKQLYTIVYFKWPFPVDIHDLITISPCRLYDSDEQ